VGATGPAGSTGPAGATGPAGPTGAAGANGAVGATGPAGTTGPAGATGPQGIQGITGSAGAVGPTGATGPQGAQGTTGSAGAIGATGPQGPAGAVGATGPAGTSFSGANQVTLSAGSPGLRLATGAEFTSNSAYGWGVSINSFYPYGNGTNPLGNSNYRWSQLFASTATISTSDVREKYEIENSDLGLDFINDLRPVSYKFLVGTSEPEVDEEGNKVFDENGKPLFKNIVPGVRNHYGLISQEVKQVLDNHTTRDFAGFVLEDKNDPSSSQMLRYSEFISPMIKAIQELSETVSNLTQEIEILKNNR
jgi:hypothetical protein